MLLTLKSLEKPNDRLLAFNVTSLLIIFISFSIIAYITQSIAISILQNTPIYVVQDIQNISNIILPRHLFIAFLANFKFLIGWILAT